MWMSLCLAVPRAPSCPHQTLTHPGWRQPAQPEQWWAQAHRGPQQPGGTVRPQRLGAAPRPSHRRRTDTDSSATLHLTATSRSLAPGLKAAAGRPHGRQRGAQPSSIHSSGRHRPPPGRPHCEQCIPLLLLPPRGQSPGCWESPEGGPLAPWAPHACRGGRAPLPSLVSVVLTPLTPRPVPPMRVSLGIPGCPHRG